MLTSWGEPVWLINCLGIWGMLCLHFVGEAERRFEQDCQLLATFAAMLILTTWNSIHFVDCQYYNLLM